MVKDSVNTSGYPLQGQMDNTLSVKIDHLEKLFDSKLLAQEKILAEKEKALTDRISRLESGEEIKQNRLFQWKTVGAGFVLGIFATVITQYFVK